MIDSTDIIIGAAYLEDLHCRAGELLLTHLEEPRPLRPWEKHRQGDPTKTEAEQFIDYIVDYFRDELESKAVQEARGKSRISIDDVTTALAEIIRGKTSLIEHTIE